MPFRAFLKPPEEEVGSSVRKQIHVQPEKLSMPSPEVFCFHLVTHLDVVFPLFTLSLAAWLNLC